MQRNILGYKILDWREQGYRDFSYTLQKKKAEVGNFGFLVVACHKGGVSFLQIQKETYFRFGT